MDFFQSQEHARRRSKLLVFYFVAAVVAIVAVVYLVALGIIEMVQPSVGYGPALWRPDVFLVAGGGALALIGLGSLGKMAALRAGGAAVALSVGGARIDPGTRDPAERRLLNVVEEMAIASGVRVPEVYVLPEEGINAFAAGYSADDAAVAVTRGAIAGLTRDELQGVIAHEFSHILNGDMRLNIRLIGLLFGILLLAIIGRGVLQSTRFIRSGRNRNAGGIMLALLLAGIALIVVGYVGVLFGRLIQAAVSRQREFLADASAVQFTRNPSGIAGALKKIGGLVAGSRVRNTHAAETSHLFFANALSGSAFNLFATHPPLVERIRAIEPSFDGTFSVAGGADGAAIATATPPPLRRTPPPIPRTKPPPLRPEQFIAAVATAAAAGPAHGAAAIESIPGPLQAAAHDASQAPLVALALLATGHDAAAAAKQHAVLAGRLGASERETLERLVPSVAGVPAETRLSLLDLALPAIRQLPADKTGPFLETIDQLIAADEQTTLFEFALRKVIRRYLRPAGGVAATAGGAIFSFQPIAEDVAFVLSALAYAGATNDDQVREAFAAGAGRLGLIRDQLALQPRRALDSARLSIALAKLERTAAPIKRTVLDALAHAAAVDAAVLPAEVELLRAVAAAIDCPAPLLAATHAG